MAGDELAELCQFCIRRARRTCYRCNVGLCSSHAKGGYCFSLYVRAALCRPCAEQWSDSPDTDDYESTSTEEPRADNREQKRSTLTVRRSPPEGRGLRNRCRRITSEGFIFDGRRWRAGRRRNA